MASNERRVACGVIRHEPQDGAGGAELTHEVQEQNIHGAEEVDRHRQPLAQVDERVHAILTLAERLRGIRSGRQRPTGSVPRAA